MKRNREDRFDVDGFLPSPRLSATGAVYGGRMVLPGVQWTGSGADLVGTVTLTAEQVADAAENRLLWTDQSVQRGIQPAAPTGTARELPLSDGYPDAKRYIFNNANADDMVGKLLRSDRVFFNPLVWNLRPSTFEAFWDADAAELCIYSGKIYLPDSHHRHQAILKAVREYRDRPRAYPQFKLARQFKVELYFLDREGEGNYFFDKNQRPTPTALSKAYDLTTEDDLAVLAKRVLDHSPRLDAGVNRATDRLNQRAPHFMTLSTLREAMRTFAGTSEVDETEMEGLAIVAAEFFDLLAEIRPELQVETAHSARRGSLASAATMIHGYAYLMRDYNLDVAKLGNRRAQNRWRTLLSAFSPKAAYRKGRFRGDFFSEDNPLWEEIGVMRTNKETGRRTILNSGGSRARAGRALRQRLSVDS